MLYGNPVLGPTGEDPMYIYIENLVEVGYRNRDGSNTKDIDVRTHIHTNYFVFLFISNDYTTTTTTTTTTVITTANAD